VYTTDVHSGPAHAREFGCLVEINGRAAGSGVGRTKKDAEQAAARAALMSLDAPRARAKSRAKPAKGEPGEANAAKAKASAKQPAVKRAKGGPATKPAKARSPIAKRATKGK
jgi:ribonuclease-3